MKENYHAIEGKEKSAAINSTNGSICSLALQKTAAARSRATQESFRPRAFPALSVREWFSSGLLSGFASSREGARLSSIAVVPLHCRDGASAVTRSVLKGAEGGGEEGWVLFDAPNLRANTPAPEKASWEGSLPAGSGKMSA